MCISLSLKMKKKKKKNSYYSIARFFSRRLFYFFTNFWCSMEDAFKRDFEFIDNKNDEIVERGDD